MKEAVTCLELRIICLNEYWSLILISVQCFTYFLNCCLLERRWLEKLNIGLLFMVMSCPAYSTGCEKSCSCQKYWEHRARSTSAHVCLALLTILCNYWLTTQEQHSWSHQKKLKDQWEGRKQQKVPPFLTQFRTRFCSIHQYQLEKSVWLILSPLKTWVKYVRAPAASLNETSSKGKKLKTQLLQSQFTAIEKFAHWGIWKRSISIDNFLSLLYSPQNVTSLVRVLWTQSKFRKCDRFEKCLVLSTL